MTTRAGRPPKPTEIKRRTGNPGKRPLPEPVSIVAGLEGVPEPPAGLAMAGLTVWRRCWEAGADWLTVGDITVMELLCRQVDEIGRWQAILDEVGVTFTTRTDMSGSTQPSPRSANSSSEWCEPRAVRLHAR